MVEVLGFESGFSLAKAQAKIGHALRICQCRSAKITLLRPNPIQVDGEPCLLDASIIEIGHKNQATMLCTRKGRFSKKVYMPPIARMLPDGHAEVLEEAGGNSSDEDPPHDGADDVQMSVYEVNIATGLADIDDSQMSSAAFELVGAVQMPLHINLDEARVVINKRYGSRLGSDWTFMRFDPKGNDGAGQYAAINTFDENATHTVEFAMPSVNVRPGFLIARHALAQRGTAEDLKNAVISGKYEHAISLLDLGVTIDSSDDGQTLLHVAAGTNQVTIVLYLLLILKTNPDVQDNTGSTALMVAAEKGCVRCVKALVQGGANVGLTDSKGRLASDVAITDSKEYLLSISIPSDDGPGTPAITMVEEDPAEPVSGDNSFC